MEQEAYVTFKTDVIYMSTKAPDIALLQLSCSLYRNQLSLKTTHDVANVTCRYLSAQWLE